MKGQVEAQVSLICVKIKAQGTKSIFVILSSHWFNCMTGHNDLDPGLIHI